jgi:hypothetical protein
MSAGILSTGKSYRQVLVELLNEYYPNDNDVALYGCLKAAITDPRIESTTLEYFVDAELSLITSMLLSPRQKLKKTN